MIVWKKIFTYLKRNNIEVYPPQTKVGEATKPYVVLKHGLSLKVGDYSSSQTIYDVLVYTPKNQYSKAYDNVEQVKTLLKGLRPMLIPTYSETEPYFDETVQAWLVSLQYKNYRKLPNKAERN